MTFSQIRHRLGMLPAVTAEQGNGVRDALEREHVITFHEAEKMFKENQWPNLYTFYACKLRLESHNS